MKILIVSQYFHPEGFKINDIAQSLIGRGYEVEVLTGLPNYPQGKFFSGYSILKGPYKENWNGVTIYRVPIIPRGQKKGIQLILNYFSFMFMAAILAPFLIRGKIDRIFIYEVSPVTVAFPAVVLKWIKKAPILFWVTDLWPETLQATGAVRSKWGLNIWGKFVQFLYRNSDLILVSSKGFINKIISRDVKRNKIEYWPQWAEELFLQEVNQDKPSDMPEGFIVTFAGNIGTSQDFETIVEAAKILKEQVDIKWIILGDGLQRNQVEQLVKEYGLENQFILLGRKPLSDMPIYYKYSDILLATLKDEPLFAITVPAKVQSYLASGKPVVVAMNGEGAELVQEAQAGFTCRASKPQELAEKVLKAYRLSEQERVKMGKNARSYFIKNFRKKILMDRLEKLLNREL